MDELIRWRFTIMRQSINDFREGDLGLNSLLQRIKGIGEVINDDEWRSDVFPLILGTEQINAAVLNGEANLTAQDKVDLGRHLLEIES